MARVNNALTIIVAPQSDLPVVDKLWKLRDNAGFPHTCRIAAARSPQAQALLIESGAFGRVQATCRSIAARHSQPCHRAGDKQREEPRELLPPAHDFRRDRRNADRRRPRCGGAVAQTRAIEHVHALVRDGKAARTRDCGTRGRARHRPLHAGRPQAERAARGRIASARHSLRLGARADLPGPAVLSRRRQRSPRRRPARRSTPNISVASTRSTSP